MASTKDITRKHFDAYSVHWSQRLNSHCYLTRFDAVASLIQSNYQSIIDFGCGTGDYSKLFADNTNYLGIDNSAGMIRRAKRLYPNRSFQIADIEKTGLADQSFDTALAIGVFEYLEKPETFATEIARVLKENGRVVCSFPHQKEKLKARGSLIARSIHKLKRLGNLIVRLKQKSRQSYSPVGYKKDSRIVHRAYDENSATKLFQDMGIELFRVRYANFRILYYWFGLDSLSSLDQIISRCILDKNWDSIFSSYASVIVVAFDKPATKLI